MKPLLPSLFAVEKTSTLAVPFLSALCHLLACSLTAHLPNYSVNGECACRLCDHFHVHTEAVNE